MGNLVRALRRNLKLSGDILKKNMPEILTAGSIACSIGAIGTAIKETPEAARKLKEAESAKGEKLTNLEVVKTVYRNYIPTATLEAMSIACSIGSGKMYRDRNASLLAAYMAVDGAFKDYRKAAEEKLSVKDEADIRKSFAEKQVDSETRKLVEDCRNGNQKFRDMFGREFITDINKVKNAINQVNARMQREDYVRLNELYFEIGLSSTEFGDTVGWNFARDGFIDPDYVATFDDETGVTTIYIDFGQNTPHVGYYQYNY